MCGMRKIEACLYVAPGDRTVLERLIADGKTPQKLAARARIVLLSGRGLGTSAIMREARVSKPTVWRWQEAYREGGIERLRKDKGKGPRAGKPRIRGMSESLCKRFLFGTVSVFVFLLQRAEEEKRSPNWMANCPMAAVHSTGLRQCTPAFLMAR
jgi:Winged helix-turn helix